MYNKKERQDPTMENAYISTVIVVIIFLHISMEIIYIIVISEWTKSIHNHIWPERGCLWRENDLIFRKWNQNSTFSFFFWPASCYASLFFQLLRTPTLLLKIPFIRLSQIPAALEKSKKNFQKPHLTDTFLRIFSRHPMKSLDESYVSHNRFTWFLRNK